MSNSELANANANGFNYAQFLKNLPHKPGVYRMLDREGQILYVGKARDLKKRVSSYFQKTTASAKTHSMVRQIHTMEVTVTNSEGEALLLENNLIKEFKPRYNILLRDDKSYPYIYLSSEDEFPRLSFHRGARKSQGKYYGPYPSAGAVRETLNLLQKVFSVRQCEDSFFRNRTRPCLQYQIKRCTAPCVGLVNKEQYAEDMRHAEMFLEGKSGAVIDELVQKMEVASKSLHFERAAKYRDQIASLRRVQEKQYVSGESGDIDVIASVIKNGVGCVQVFFIRGGLNLGNKTYFPKQTSDATCEDILYAFITQFYLSSRGNRIIPAEIITNGEIADSEVLTQILSEQAGRKVALSPRVRGERARWVNLAESNAHAALVAHLSTKANVLKRFELLQDALGLDDMPQRMECFDISHTFGEAPVASCVVMDANGAVKSDYRKFNIEGVTPGDDYAAMHQALTRRYTRLKKGEGKIPDILFIDGGKGQVSEAEKVLEELQINGVTLIGVAKGSERKPGLETLIVSGQAQPVHLPQESPALHLIQQIRDEAHRFAISAHRNRRSKARKSSILEEIPGLGPKRRQLILKQFGGLQQVSRVGVEDLAKLPGISPQLAQRIYDTLHPED
ncbi:excinuclease ABC subunit UvrC [Kaarinaea lacus]